jgi:hypothetical protein
MKIIVNHQFVMKDVCPVILINSVRSVPQGTFILAKRSNAYFAM